MALTKSAAGKELYRWNCDWSKVTSRLSLKNTTRVDERKQALDLALTNLFEVRGQHEWSSTAWFNPQSTEHQHPRKEFIQNIWKPGTLPGTAFFGEEHPRPQSSSEVAKILQQERVSNNWCRAEQYGGTLWARDSDKCDQIREETITCFITIDKTLLPGKLKLWCWRGWRGWSAHTLKMGSDSCVA